MEIIIPRITFPLTHFWHSNELIESLERAFGEVVFFSLSARSPSKQILIEENVKASRAVNDA